MRDWPGRHNCPDSYQSLGSQGPRGIGDKFKEQSWTRNSKPEDLALADFLRARGHQLVKMRPHPRKPGRALFFFLKRSEARDECHRLSARQVGTGPNLYQENFKTARPCA